MAKIFISYGINMLEMTCGLMERADVAKRLDAGMRICIKPNLVVEKTADSGATTHPEIIEGIIQYLLSCNIRDITVAEGAWIGASTKRAWDVCGYSGFARKYNVKLVDTKEDRVITKPSRGMELNLCESILKADYLINVPVLKGHCQTLMTCCLKNLKGCIPDGEKRRFHSMGLHKPIAALADAIRPDLHIVDGICGDLCFEEGGNPVESNRIMLGFDPMLLDSYGAQLMGYNPDEIAYLRYARDYGVGEYVSESTEMIELNAESKPKVQAVNSRAVKSFAQLIDEDGACSACYAALVFALDKLDKTKRLNLNGKICIGQGFKGRSIQGIGVGNCAAGCTQSIAGCPPKAVDIIKFLQGQAAEK